MTRHSILTTFLRQNQSFSIFLLAIGTSFIWWNLLQSSRCYSTSALTEPFFGLTMSHILILDHHMTCPNFCPKLYYPWHLHPISLSLHSLAASSTFDTPQSLCISSCHQQWKLSQLSLKHPVCWDFSKAFARNLKLIWANEKSSHYSSLLFWIFIFLCEIFCQLPDCNFQIQECIQANFPDFNIDKPRFGKLEYGIY